MAMQQPISIGNLLLDTSNYRINRQDSQKAARDAIIAEQGRKLVKLAEDIIQNGLNPFDLPMVIDAADGNQNFIVVEGNRRLTSMLLVMNPELSKDTPIHSAFVKLNKKHADAIPRIFPCVIARNRKTAQVWINRKHANGLEGAGTEPWSAMAKARADQDQGIARPDMDVIDYMLAEGTISDKTRKALESSKFNLTTLERLLTTKELQEEFGLSLKGGKVYSYYEKPWLTAVVSDLITTIAEGKFQNGDRKGKKFTEREVDSPEKRSDFVQALISDHPKRTKALSQWQVGGEVANSTPKKKPLPTVKPLPSLADQPNLVPKKFKLALPAGKINDIFVEMKKLDVKSHRHAVSVLMRVFLELSIEEYLESEGIPLEDGKYSTLLKKFQATIQLLEKNGVMTAKELSAIKTELSDKNSLVSPVTLNAYVHSKWMEPDELRLKVTWANLQLMLERLWNSINNHGQE